MVELTEEDDDADGGGCGGCSKYLHLNSVHRNKLYIKQRLNKDSDSVPPTTRGFYHFTYNYSSYQCRVVNCSSSSAFWAISFNFNRRVLIGEKSVIKVIKLLFEEGPEGVSSEFVVLRRMLFDNYSEKKIVSIVLRITSGNGGQSVGRG